MKELEIQFDLPRSRAEVFNFVSDVRHLDLMTPPWLRFAVRQVSGAPGLGSLRPGTTIDYRLRWRHLPLVWRSEITVWQPDDLFTYEMRRGPYRRWIHEHIFESRDGGTRVTDRVWWSAFGEKLMGGLVERDIREIFEYRARWLVSRMAGDLRALS